MDAEPELVSASRTSVDVFGTVEQLAPPKSGHIREAVESSPPPSPVYTPAGRVTPSRTGSRRTQSVDISARGVRQPVTPSPLGPARRRRGEKEREAGHERRRKDSLRAELDATSVALGLQLDPRIASDVLALERRFAAASKGKSPARQPRAHRPRHSLPANPNRTDLLSSPNRAHSLAPLPEFGTITGESDDSRPPTVGPALPSSGVRTPSPSFSLSKSDPSAHEATLPPIVRVEKPTYSSLLPTSDPEPPSSGLDVKRTKRTSLTAMFGIHRKKEKGQGEKEKDKDHDSDVSQLPLSSPPRPIPIRIDTYRTTRTTNTVLTTNTSATAGSDEHGPIGSSPMDLSPSIEPSAKTLARAAATRDQLAKRYAAVYAGIGGGDAGSMLSSGSGSTPRGLGVNPLDIIRWRSAKKAAVDARSLNGRTDEVWAREVERRIRDYPLPTALGDSLPEATSLSWLPYLEPVFAEERGGSDEHGAVMAMASPGEKPRPMTAWYILASFVEEYVHHEEEKHLAEVLPTPIPRSSDVSPSSHAKTTSDVRARAILNAAYARSGNTSDNNEPPGAKFGILDKALRTRSRQSSVAVEPTTNGLRSRQSSVGMVGSASIATVGTFSEPPSPSAQSHPIPNTGSIHLLTPGDGVRSGRSHSASSQVHSRTHSRSQSQVRSTSAGNQPNGGVGGNGSIDWTFHRQGITGDGKSMSPASSRMNLASFIMGSAAVLGLNKRRRHGGGVGKEVVSGSDNESARVSSDVSPIPSDADVRPGIGRGGLSDGEGGRVKIKGRKKTWREGERVTLSDGGGGGSGSGERDSKRRSWRQSMTVLIPVPTRPEKELEVREKAGREAREKEKEYTTRRKLVDETRERLSDVDARLSSFTQLATELNVVHRRGFDIFGDMFMEIPQAVVSAFSPDLSEEDGSLPLTPTSTYSLTPISAHPHALETICAFARRLEGEEEPITVDTIGRAKLDANLPIRAFEVLHALDHGLKDISNRVQDLRRICEDAERERKSAKALYETTAVNVETTYIECTQIEQVLGSLVTEDMPWLPSWLPLWVRHLLEIFSNQIQFLVENGLRIYGYIYHIVSIFVFLFSFVLGGVFVFARFIRSIWWAFVIAGIAALVYLMTRPPEGTQGFVEEGL